MHLSTLKSSNPATAKPSHWRRLEITLCLFVMALVPLALTAEEVKVTITNLAPSDGVFLTPVWIGFHTGAFDLYELGGAVGPDLERLAEDGSTLPLMDQFNLMAPTGSQRTLDDSGGPVMAGRSVSINFDLNPTEHRYFSLASMVIPSNDAFIGNEDTLAYRAFDNTGNFTPIEFYVFGRDVLDAGTEVNDEEESSTAALGQAAPDTGVDENGTVTSHPGFMAGGRILTARPNGDFTSPGYRIAKVTVELAPRTTISFVGSGGQEVPSVSTTATAACEMTLTEFEDSLTVTCHHNVQDPIAAHIHEGPAGMNGPVVFPFMSAASPIRETFSPTEAQVEALLAGNYYVNIHSQTNQGGEVRGQIDGCFEGPRSLCLLGDRFKVTALWETNQGTSGDAVARQATSDSGQFVFFDPDNIELDVKVLGGCAVNNSYWVFIAGLTDVQVDIEVTDTVTGAVRSYANPLEQPFELVRDIEAFPCS